MEAPPTVGQAIGVLKLASQWEMETGRLWAVKHLESLEFEEFHPALRLKLGRKFGVEGWIKTAVSALLQYPLKFLEEQHTQWLGFPVYVVLARCREALESERRLVALIPLDISNELLYRPLEGCTDHHQCSRVWKSVWWERIGKMILHPNALLGWDFRDVKRKLKGIEFNGMNDGCRDTAIKEVLASRALDIDEAYIDEVLKMLNSGKIEAERSDVDLE